MRSISRAKVSLLATGLTFALAISACATATEGGSDNQGTQLNNAEVPHGTGLVGVEKASGHPERGGTLTFGVYAELRTFDPAKAPDGGGAGVAGGSEITALYDVLVRYNPSTGKYQPWLAKSLEHNDDYTTWTLKLRPDVTFSDRTPLNAQAVVFNMRRLKKIGGSSASLVEPIAKMDTPDQYTVVFHLTDPWSRFPYVLSVGPGHIVSPTAVRKWGDQFGQHPVGAGPFLFDHYSPGEELVLTANPNYWGGRPYVDKLRFVALQNDQTRLDTLESGGLQMAFLRDPKVVVDARKRGYGGFANVMYMGSWLQINNQEGRPGSDRRVRKAIAYAINTEKVDQRVHSGEGLPTKKIFFKTSRWDTDAKATPYDPDQAKKLVAEAKQDGYGGTLRLVCARGVQREAVSLKAQLNAAGFHVRLDMTRTIADEIRKVDIKHDYDVACSGISVPEASPWAKLKQAITSNGSLNDAQYANQHMDNLISQLQVAPDIGAKRSVIEKIQRLWTKTVPSVPMGAVSEFIAWDKQVHGVVPTAFTTVILANAWIDKS